MQFHASENKPTQFFDEITLVRNAPNTKYIEQLRWTGALSSKALLEVGGGHLHGTQSSLQQPAIKPGDLAAVRSRLTLLNSGARPTYSDSPGYRNFINSSFSYAAGEHYLKFGWQYDGSVAISHTFSMSNYPAGLLAIYRSGIPDSVSTYNTPTDAESPHLTGVLRAGQMESVPQDDAQLRRARAEGQRRRAGRVHRADDFRRFRLLSRDQGRAELYERRATAVGDLRHLRQRPDGAEAERQPLHRRDRDPVYVARQRAPHDERHAVVDRPQLPISFPSWTSSGRRADSTSERPTATRTGSSSRSRTSIR